MGEGPLGTLQLVDLAAIQIGLALVLGAWASSRWFNGADSPWSARCIAWTRRGARFGAAVGVAGLAAAVWLQAAVMTDVPLSQAGSSVVTLLRDTHYGHVALVGFAAWCITTVLAWRGSFGLWLPAAVVLTAWSRSAVSHAANSGDYSFDVAVDVLHLLATSLWVGMVLIAAKLPRPSQPMSDRLDASRWVEALSSYATATLGVVVLTGLFKVYRAVPNWTLLPASDYGRTLFFKLGLVAAAVFLGGYNRFRVLPGLSTTLGGRTDPSADFWNSRFLRVVRIEMLVLLAVVGWAALLSSSEPAG